MDFEAYLNAASPPQAQAMAQIRLWLQEEVPDVSMAMKWGRPIFACAKNFAYFKTTKKHLTFGFFDATGLHDEAGLLEGSGALMRHLKITETQRLPEDTIRLWIRQAAANAR